jgi:hypothetical protein
MKTVAAIALLWVSSSQWSQTVVKSSSAHQPAGQEPSEKTASKIDPANDADIRRLFEVGGTKAAMTEMMTRMEKNLKVLANSFPAGEYRDQLIDLFLEKFHAKADPQAMLELAVPVYDKYLSDDEIEGLIQSYSTPLGQKALHTYPKLMSECFEAGSKWGEQIGRDAMMEVLSEHPQLQKALEDAQRGSKAQ